MKIITAYDAFHFLNEHPKFMCREAALVEDGQEVTLHKGERLRKVCDAFLWNKGTYTLHEFAARREAFPENLDIFYSKTDDRGRVNKDSEKNVNVECWLEFGKITYVVRDGRLACEHGHDIRLDVGAPTFDQALIKLARRVRRIYGDIPTPKWMGK